MPRAPRLKFGLRTLLLAEAGAMFGDPQVLTDLLTTKQFTPAVIAKAIAATDKSHSCQVTYMGAKELRPA